MRIDALGEQWTSTLLFKMNVLLGDADLLIKYRWVPIYNGGRVSGYELCPIPYYKAIAQHQNVYVVGTNAVDLWFQGCEYSEHFEF